MTRRRIVRDSTVPYYEQLREIIAASIDAGQWRPGELIPSEAELTSTYEISRTVIRKALDLLGNQGRIRRIKGKGTVVVEPFLWDTSPELTGPYDALAASYRIQSVIENRIVVDDDELGGKLGIENAGPILHVVTISERSNRPGVVGTLSRFDIAGDASPALGRLTQDGRTPHFQLGGPPIPVQLTARFGLRLSHSPTTLSANNCNESEAGLLGVAPGVSVFCFEWVTYDISGRAVIIGRSLTGNNPRLRLLVRHNDAMPASHKPI